MSNRTLNILVVLLLTGIAALFVINLLPILIQQPVEKFIGFNDVRGIAVEHGQKLWTLDFNEQNHVIEYFNRAILVKKEGLANKEELPFQSVIIYRFKGSDIVLKPMGKNNNDLVFSAPLWSGADKDTYLQDVTGGELQKLIQSTYDP